MIGYVTLGTNDLDKAAAFYDALLATVGGKRMMDLDRGIFWVGPNGMPGIAAMKPYDEKPATVGNGTMVALAMSDKAQVEAFHAKALELGAADEGAPGPRGDGFYGAYFRDPDGNKLAAFCLV